MSNIHFKLIYLKNACSTCRLKLPYIKETLQNLAREFPGSVSYQEVQLDSRKSVEKLTDQVGNVAFPVLLINDRLFSAGIVPNPAELREAVNQGRPD